MFCSVTNLSADDAARHLEAFDQNLEAAVNSALLDAAGGGGGGTGAGAVGDEDGDHVQEELVDTDDEDVAELEEVDDEEEEADGDDGALPAAGAPPPAAPRAAGGAVGPFARYLGALRGTLGAWLLPAVSRYFGGLVGFVGFALRLLLVTPLRMLLGYGGLDGGGVGGGRLAGGGGRGFAQTRESINAQGTREARRFIELLEARYGPGPLLTPFALGSLQQAIEIAKVDLRFILIYVHADEAEAALAGGAALATGVFCRGVLSSELFQAVLEQHFVPWAADLSTPGGLRMARALGLREGPALAMLAYGEMLGGERSELRVLERLGPARCRTVETVVSALVAVVEKHEPMLVAARAERSERQVGRMIRDEQDAELKESLAADQARDRREEQAKQQSAAAAAACAERERCQAEAEAREEAVEVARVDARRLKGEALPPEPEAGLPDVSRVAVRLPDGRRLDRRWLKSTKLQLLVDWVSSVELDTYDVGLVSQYPRREFTMADHGLSLEEAGLHPQAMLFVREAAAEGADSE